LSTPEELSATAAYTLSFRINSTLDQGETITVRFPDDTDASGAAVAGGGVSYTSGIGFDSGASTVIGVAVDPDDPIVTITLTTLSTASIGAMAYVQVVMTGIVNPTEPGTYTLEVQTEIEDTYVESESYDIGVPVVGGFVYVYNPSNILLATFGGSAALDNAAAPIDYFAKAGYTIKVGEGTFTLAGDIGITGEGLTLESAEGALDTIIDADGNVGITIGAADVTIEGFTIDLATNGIAVGAFDGAIVQNNIIINATTAGIAIAAGGIDAAISDNDIEDCVTGIAFAATAGSAVISDNEITGADTLGAIAFAGGNDGNEISGNTITGNSVSGICFVAAGAVSDDNLIEGNTIALNDPNGIHIDTANAPTNLVIRENDIIDNEEFGIVIDSWDAVTDVIIFNNLSGNADGNIDTAVDVTAAVFNWWGSADEDDITDGLLGVGVVTYTPWLLHTQETIASAVEVATDTSSLTAKTTVGVNVSGMDDDTVPSDADAIIAFKYIANPQDAIDDAIAFYDVYVDLDDAIVVAEVSAKVKFYGATITENSTVSFWTGDFWAECSDQVARAGLVQVTVTEDTVPALDELEGTAFVVVASEAVEEEVVYTCPQCGLSFATEAGLEAHWNAVHAPPPVVEPEPEPQVWTCAQCGLTFDTRDELVAHIAEAHPPVEPVEPVELPDIILEPADIILEAPDIIVPLPAETPITPAWIYVIIGVGAVLVISVIVLIVRTRRVA